MIPYEVVFEVDDLKKKLKRIDSIMARERFWGNQDRAKKILKIRAQLLPCVEGYDEAARLFDDAKVLFELAEEENDLNALSEVAGQAKKLDGKLEELEMQRMLRGQDDFRNAIVSINAGAGGTEAQDWASMILRMYLRWAERRGYATEILDMLDGDEAGLKSTTFIVKGLNAYGFLKAEAGIHRLVRISPFDAGGRRHTSFASVSVYPEIDDEIVIEVRDEDIRIDTFRASGHGGQHVNKTSSAIRITHYPTGIVVTCQNEKSQHRNKESAMKVLKARLYEMEEKKKAEEMEKIHKDKKEISWGSQIRSYVLQPYRLVKDHRTDTEKGNVDAVLDGDLDDFIQAYLLSY